VRLGGGYRGDGIKAVVDESAPIYKAALCGSLLASAPLLSPGHCSSDLAFLRRGSGGGCSLAAGSDPYPLRCIEAVRSLEFGAVLSALQYNHKMGLAEQRVEVRGAANRR